MCSIVQGKPAEISYQSLLYLIALHKRGFEVFVGTHVYDECVESGVLASHGTPTN